ncbi:MAG TPA: carbohydrate ABC transporter permease [Aeromicrobium sp.]|nr:carbohydrate ABC transporter permease [Aeromicrobium sp.]
MNVAIRPGERQVLHSSPAARPRRRRRGETGKVVSWVATHSVAVALAFFFVLPFVFVFLTSAMSDSQALTSNLWPTQWHWENYAKVFETPNFGLWWINSLIYSTVGTALMLLSSVPAAYAMAKLRFRGRNLSLIVVVATMMLPPQAIIIPMYLIWSQLGLTGSLWPLIVPLAFGDGYSIFLLRQFLLTIPREYLDAARVDGCGSLGTLVRVVIPMCKPALLAVGLFQFFFCWNDYFGPQIYTSENPLAWTLSYGLASFKGAHHANWNMTMAATLLVMLPVMILFFFAQKSFIEGITLTGVKG